VAYNLYLLAQSGEPVAQRAILHLIDAAVRVDSTISSAPHGDGVGWAAYDVSTSRALSDLPDDPLLDFVGPEKSSGPILLQLDTRPDSVRHQVESARRRGAPAAVAGSDTFIELTMSGHTTDWLIADVICAVASRLWNAAMYDEESDGFA
jgi:hypothetical protein